MTELASIRAVVRGQVQRVFFRASTAEKARTLGLTGFARNLPDGNSVEVEAEGDKTKLEELVKWLHSGPPRARVDNLTVDWQEYKRRYQDFTVRY